jgi:hypothetical protein
MQSDPAAVISLSHLVDGVEFKSVIIQAHYKAASKFNQQCDQLIFIASTSTMCWEFSTKVSHIDDTLLHFIKNKAHLTYIL